MLRLLYFFIFHLSHLHLTQCKWHRTYDIEYCPSPPHIPNAFPMPESWDGIDKMKQAFLSYKCENGYSHIGDISIYCVKRRHVFTWSKPAFSCDPISCVPPISPKNGKTVGSNYTFGEFISFKCDEGYNLHSSDGKIALAASPMQVCTSNGTWSGQVPQCVEVVCPYPATLPNGYAVVTSREIGGKLLVQCNAGFVKHGAPDPVCSSAGKWKGNVPSCVMKIKPRIVQKFIKPESTNRISVIKDNDDGIGQKIWSRMKEFFTFE